MKTKLPAIALAALLFAGLPLASSSAFVAVSVAIAPPVIPVYEQPYCPAPNYIWTPGYWDYADFGYYWVPGVWVAPPRVGLLWTPGYWGYQGGQYVFNAGYWGPTIGYYGGINYGFGYVGHGYYGGEWVGGAFRYNTAVSRVNTTIIHNTYNKTVVNENTGSRASYNGPGGVTAKPTAQEQAAAKAPHVSATAAQRSQMTAAKNNPATHFSTNQGKPAPEVLTGKQTAAKTSTAAEKTASKATPNSKAGQAATVNHKASQTASSAEQTGPKKTTNTGHVTSHAQVASHKVQPRPGPPAPRKAGPPQPEKKGKKKTPPQGQG